VRAPSGSWVAPSVATFVFARSLVTISTDHAPPSRARTVAAYRDTFRLLLGFVKAKFGTAPTAIVMTDLDANLTLNFLDHLERDRKKRRAYVHFQAADRWPPIRPWLPANPPTPGEQLL
jgi:hypothetical protein